MAEKEPDNPPHPVPETLLQDLDEANKRFHEAREHLEQAIKSNEFDHGDLIDQKRQELKAAEGKLEEITGRISRELGPTPPPA